MDVNLVSMYGLATSIASAVLVLVIIPGQTKEVKRPDRGFRFFRKRLLLELWLVLALMSLRIPYFISALSAPSRGWWPAVIGIATSTAIFLFAHNKYKVFTYKEKS